MKFRSIDVSSSLDRHVPLFPLSTDIEGTDLLHALSFRVKRLKPHVPSYQALSLVVACCFETGVHTPHLGPA